jgi:hypothetical protein
MTSRDRWAVAIGGFLVVIAWSLMHAPRAWRDWSAWNDRLDRNRALLRETKLAIAALPAMEDSMRRLSVAVASAAPQLLSGTLAAEAGADLAARLRSFTGLEHGSIVSMTPVIDTMGSGMLRRVGVTATIQTDFRGVAGIMRLIGRDSVAMIVDRLRVSRIEPSEAAGAAERLQVELRLWGWFLPRSAA